MSEATQSQTQSIEQTLNKTDFGHILYENRKTFIAVIIAILVGATGFMIWKQTQKSAALETSVKVFEFQSGVWSDVKAGKVEASNLVTSFKALDQKVQEAPVMLPVLLEMSKFLYDKDNFAEAESILSEVGSSNKDQIYSFFLGLQKALVLEKLGKMDEAIATLEPLAKDKEALMPARLSVELGRMYLANDNKAKAQTQFEHVINTYPNEDQAKMAKLYLSQISK